MADEESSQSPALNYKPPAEKSLNEILEADKDDDSLRRYKETLLGSASKLPIVVDQNNPNTVIIKSLTLIPEDHEALVLDLTGDLTKLKEQKFDIKQGIKYKVQIRFYVQRDIVTGLKYTQTIKRGMVKVEKLSQMVGSYAPKSDLQVFTTEEEEMPAGILCFGTYDVESAFVDDDNHVHLKWDWSFKLKKNWEEK